METNTKAETKNIPLEQEIDEILVEGTNDQISKNICEPIKNLIQLRACIENPPEWVKSIVPLSPRSNFVVKNSSSDCHYECDSFLPQTRYDSRIVPRTLVCHDMKNGYLEDKYNGSMKVGNGYTFYHWAQIDSFVYFTHHFITIPPLSWINIAHNNGVKILGTLITEWQEGSKLCEVVFQDQETMRSFASALVDVTEIFKIDGWLLNIENSVEHVEILKDFVQYLTEEIHRRIPGSLIIWYDSVIGDGTLAWQNELNDKNKCFFDSCDGIFLNYTWKEENLVRSVKNAKHRCLDVYVGIDVFGRNTYGGGRFNAHVAAEAIRKHNLSIALFAQGWTHETLSKTPEDTILERFLNRNNAFWCSLWKYLYTHPINKFFETFFYTGVDKHWYNLHNQDIQLTKILQPRLADPEYSKVPTIADSCKCMQLHVDDKNTACLLKRIDAAENPTIHHLFTCNIEVDEKIVFYVVTKKVLNETCGDFNLVIITQNSSGRFDKYVCLAYQRGDIPKSGGSEIFVNPSDGKILRKIKDRFGDDQIMLRSYVIEFKDSRILEVGAEILRNSVACLSGFGILREKYIEFA